LLPYSSYDGRIFLIVCKEPVSHPQYRLLDRRTRECKPGNVFQENTKYLEV
jgi:hypothetical protein